MAQADGLAGRPLAQAQRTHAQRGGIGAQRGGIEDDFTTRQHQAGQRGGLARGGGNAQALPRTQCVGTIEIQRTAGDADVAIHLRIRMAQRQRTVAHAHITHMSHSAEGLRAAAGHRQIQVRGIIGCTHRTGEGCPGTDDAQRVGCSGSRRRGIHCICAGCPGIDMSIGNTFQSLHLCVVCVNGQRNARTGGSTTRIVQHNRPTLHCRIRCNFQICLEGAACVVISAIHLNHTGEITTIPAQDEARSSIMVRGGVPLERPLTTQVIDVPDGIPAGLLQFQGVVGGNLHSSQRAHHTFCTHIIAQDGGRGRFCRGSRIIHHQCTMNGLCACGIQLQVTARQGDSACFTINTKGGLVDFDSPAQYVE